MKRIGIAVALLLCGAALAGEPVKIVVLDVAPNDPSLEPMAAAITEQVLTELSQAGRFRVVGKSDIVAMVGLERQKQLLGCAEDASTCLAELAGALGSPYMISGALARVGSKLRLDLKLLQTEKSEVLARQGAVVDGEDQLFATVAQLVGSLAANPVFGDAVKPPSRAPQVAIGAVGAVAAVAGAIVLGVQFSQGDVLASRPAGFTIVEAEQRRAGIYTMRPIGAGLVAGGLALAAAGTIWFAVAGSRTHVSLAPIDGGALAHWSVAW